MRPELISLVLLWSTLFTPTNLTGQILRDGPTPQQSSQSEDLADVLAPRPGIGTFAEDLARNSIGLFSRENLLPFLVGAGVTAATHQADRRVQDYFDGGNRFGVFEEGVGEQLGRLPVVLGTVGGLFTLSRFHGSDTFSRFSYDLAQASALNGITTFTVKRAVGRVRPNEMDSVSFPSGHTSAAFAAATVVDHYYGTAASVTAYATAAFVAASRLDAGKHYLSDVVAGATLGYIIGRTVTRRSAQRSNGLRWAPIVSPGTESMGVAVSWQFGNQ